ncbi:multicopper oxidase domain-containing protein [Alloacidobacterium dinghuense]|uniref:Multicopper oxidase domain-containing protein n=2 Tax=Alloacidobacterium dinghuense TaxID=2763107 RepID=A0A7G8BRN7_9BACT|nr:multicopper oxidase domain-containing protein [Alloacidobacterium dinghuense]
MVLAGGVLGRKISAAEKAEALDPSTLKAFVDPLPVPAVAKAVGVRQNPEDSKEQIPFYHVAMREAMVKVHRDLPPTKMWTLGGSFPGPTIETQIAKGMIVEWMNELPAKHFLPIDHSLHGAGKDVPEVRGVVHLHGGRTPPESDGYPEEWVVPGKSQTCFYPSSQHAALLFYHDHTMGINRLNTYAGMMGMFIIRDPREDVYALPSGKYEIPLLICDRMLKTDGQLEYPVSEKTGEVWVPEVFGNAILANGKLLPYCEVEPRLYRFRVMNGSNGRFFRFSLESGAEFYQVGSDQGLLVAPAKLKRVTMAPGERADLLIDFSSMAGQRVNFVSDSFSILQFRVGKTAAGERGVVPEKLHEFERIAESSAVKTRQLTLDENMDDIQRSMGMLLNKTPWHAPITEKPVLDSTEIWELVNLTDDSHPIHLHLVRFQILDRRRFEAFHFQDKGELWFTGPVVKPDANEMGWKDTVRCDPNMVTRIIVPFNGYAGRYVWHCHVLEHEDNEMMRPFEVVKG